MLRTKVFSLLALGFLCNAFAADRADAASWYSYAVQVKFHSYEWNTHYWADRETYADEDAAKDRTMFLMLVKKYGYLYWYFPQPHHHYHAVDVRLVRRPLFVYGPAAEQWYGGDVWYPLEMPWWYRQRFTIR